MKKVILPVVATTVTTVALLIFARQFWAYKAAVSVVATSVYIAGAVFTISAFYANTTAFTAFTAIAVFAAGASYTAAAVVTALAITDAFSATFVAPAFIAVLAIIIVVAKAKKEHVSLWKVCLCYVAEAASIHLAVRLIG